MKIDKKCWILTFAQHHKEEPDIIPIIHVTNCKCSKEGIHIQDSGHIICKDCFDKGFEAACAREEKAFEPIALLIHCPQCGMRHIDSGEFATKLHHTHACQDCGHVWRPAKENTVGVRFLPGYKNEG